MKQSKKTLLSISAAITIAIATGSTVYARSTNQQIGHGTIIGDNTTAMMSGQGGGMGNRSAGMSGQSGMMNGQSGGMGGQNGMMGSRSNMMMNMMMGGRSNMTGKAKAYMDKRLTNAKRALGITQNQESAWNTYAKAVRAQIDQMSTRMASGFNGQKTSVNQRAALMTTHAAQMQEIATTAKQLYKKLTPAQRIKANQWLPLPGNAS